MNIICIADRCILYDVSWTDLDANGLVYGKEIIIDGYSYNVRLLMVGVRENAPNEWDAALNVVGEDDAIWNWKDALFWGQERVGSVSDSALRGYTSARNYDNYSSANRCVHYGFRPAIVPRCIGRLNQVHAGQQLMLWEGENIVHGRLDELTEYDAILSAWSGTTPDKEKFSKPSDDGCLVVDRDAVSGVQKRKY